jgi:hypothetical protein
MVSCCDIEMHVLIVAPPILLSVEWKLQRMGLGGIADSRFDIER